MIIIKKTSSLIFPTLFFICLLALIIFSKDSFNVAKNSFILWATVVVPSLFSFLVLTELISKTGIIKFIGVLLEPIMRPIFNVPGIGAFALVVGLTSGYPTGAKVIKDLYTSKQCTLIEAERLLTFTNNCSPLFITGAVSIGILNEASIGIKLLIIHQISAILVGILFRFYKFNKEKTPKQSNKNLLQKAKLVLYNTPKINISNIGPILTESIKNSFSTIMLIGGFIVIFSVLLNILINLKVISIITIGLKFIFMHLEIPLKLASTIISGIIELTTGVNTLLNIELPLKFKLITTSFILGFGGISVIFQVAGVICNTNISIKPYIIAKLLQASIAALIAYYIF